jgi:putative glycolipid-binding protein
VLSERSALVTGWVGGETIDIMVMRDAGGQWQLNGRCIENVAGGSDIDLNFSPSTNLLPIRRLNLAVGATAPVRAAGLRFPSFSISLTPGWLRDTIATKALGGEVRGGAHSRRGGTGDRFMGASGTERPSLRQNPREDAFTHELPSSPEADCLACDLRTLFHRSSHFGKSAVSAESPPRNSRRAATRNSPFLKIHESPQRFNSLQSKGGPSQGALPLLRHLLQRDLRKINVHIEGGMTSPDDRRLIPWPRETRLWCPRRT